MTISTRLDCQGPVHSSISHPSMQTKLQLPCEEASSPLQGIFGIAKPPHDALFCAFGRQMGCRHGMPSDLDSFASVMPPSLPFSDIATSFLDGNVTSMCR